MFYDPRNGHGLPHDPFRAIVAPRPIGWISTRSATGAVNLAPFSFFCPLSVQPYLICFSSEGEKDSVAFARETGEFTANLVTGDLFDAMNASSVDAPRGTSEFAYAGLTAVQGTANSAPRVGEAHAALECKVTEIREPCGLDGKPSGMIVVTGEVVGIHINDAMLKGGLFDPFAEGIVSRLGYMDYATTRETFEARRPRWTGDMKG